MIEGHYISWKEVNPSDWPWVHFSPREMACRGSGELLVAPAFMGRLEMLRGAYGRPMPVTSGYRTPEYNRQVGGGEKSGHLYGRAIDVAVSGQNAYNLVRYAMALGFTGIGVSQKGPHRERFVHLDELENGPDTPRPRVWSY